VNVLTSGTSENASALALPAGTGLADPVMVRFTWFAHTEAIVMDPVFWTGSLSERRH
jgi:hypothetical protein